MPEPPPEAAGSGITPTHIPAARLASTETNDAKDPVCKTKDPDLCHILFSPIP
jgi:hypothetical protein